MNIEFPNDWGATKRGSHHYHHNNTMMTNNSTATTAANPNHDMSTHVNKIKEDLRSTTSTTNQDSSILECKKNISKTRDAATSSASNPLEASTSCKKRKEPSCTSSSPNENCNDDSRIAVNGHGEAISSSNQVQKQHHEDILATSNKREEEEEEATTANKCKIVKGPPLGPRGLFNAVTHDTPEKGQLKEIVMRHLETSDTKMKKSSDENHTFKVGEQNTKDENCYYYCDVDDDEHLQMEVHCLLSKLPYQKMLSDLFGYSNDSSSSGSNHHNNTSYDKELLPSPNIPYVTRAYEESFMREPINSTERLCAKGDQCECMFIDPENPFTAIEFLLPGEKQPPTPHLCVVCCKAVTQQLYYDILFDKHDFGGVIQRFGNIHSQPGEYALDAMLIAAPNVALHIMPLPIVSHQRNRYSVFIKRGIKHLKQSRVYFHSTPSC